MLRYLAQDPDIDLTVFYMSDMSVNGFADPQFKVQVKWDVPLLGGYRHVFLKRLGASTVTPLVRPLVVGLPSALRRARLDALWLHGYKHQVQLRAICAARSLGIPILVRGDSNGLETGLTRGISSKVVQRLFRIIDAFLCIGSQNRQFYSNRGVGGEKLFSVPYAVDNAYFQNAIQRASSSREELQTSLNVISNAPVILYAGKLTEGKRPVDLLMAYSRVVRDFERGSEPYLVFVGDGKLRWFLEQFVLRLQLDRVRFAGFVNQSEMPRYYDLCDIFVLPSERERWGLAVNEAMNAAKPVIVTDKVGCAPDLVHEGENGFVVPTGDVAALTSRLSLLLDHRSLRDEMGQASLRIVSNFSFEQDLQGLKAALRHVCKGCATLCGPEPQLEVEVQN